MKGSQFVFDFVQLLHNKCYKTNPNYGGSYIDSLDWIKNKKATINPTNKRGKCLQYTITVALNYEKIKGNPERLTKVKHFIAKCNWGGINYSSEKGNCTKSGKHNLTIALNFLYAKMR